MTKLRKLTALLLAGALTLLLLTACGGGGSSSPEAQAEANVMQAINKGRTMALANDPEMHAIAKTSPSGRTGCFELKGNIVGYGVYNKVRQMGRDSNGTLTLIAQYDYKIPSCRRSHRPHSRR